VGFKVGLLGDSRWVFA